MQIIHIISLYILGLVASAYAFHEHHDLYARDDLSARDHELSARNDEGYHDLLNREADGEDMVLIPRSLAESSSDVLAKRELHRRVIVKCRSCGAMKKRGKDCNTCGA